MRAKREGSIAEVGPGLNRHGPRSGGLCRTDEQETYGVAAPRAPIAIEGVIDVGAGTSPGVRAVAQANAKMDRYGGDLDRIDVDRPGLGPSNFGRWDRAREFLDGQVVEPTLSGGLDDFPERSTSSHRRTTTRPPLEARVKAVVMELISACERRACPVANASEEVFRDLVVGKGSMSDPVDRAGLLEAGIFADPRANNKRSC